MCCQSSTLLRCQSLSLWDGKWKHDLFSCLLLHYWQPQACVWPETALSSWWPFLDVSSLLTARQVEADNCKAGNNCTSLQPVLSVPLPSKSQLSLGLLSCCTLLWAWLRMSWSVVCLHVEHSHIRKAQCVKIGWSPSKLRDIKKICPWGNASSSVCGPLCFMRVIGLNLIRMPSSSVLYGQNF